MEYFQTESYFITGTHEPKSEMRTWDYT